MGEGRGVERGGGGGGAGGPDAHEHSEVVVRVRVAVGASVADVDFHFALCSVRNHYVVYVLRGTPHPDLHVERGGERGERGMVAVRAMQRRVGQVGIAHVVRKKVLVMSVPVLCRLVHQPFTCGSSGETVHQLRQLRSAAHRNNQHREPAAAVGIRLHHRASCCANALDHLLSSGQVRVLPRQHAILAVPLPPPHTQTQKQHTRARK